MPEYVIERDVSGAGTLSPTGRRAILQTSHGVLGKPGPQIQWQQSDGTAGKVCFVYIAPNEKSVREPSQGVFPANRVSEVASVIDPTTAESHLE